MSNFYKKVTSVDENGEIIGQEIIKFYNPFKAGKGYNFKYKSINIKSYLDTPLPKCFTDAEVGRIYRLSRYIYSDSNLLAKRTGGSIKPYSKDEIQEIIGLHRTKFNPFWKKVIGNMVVKPNIISGMEFYCFNPLYFNSTTYLPVYLYITFQDELREHLPPWVIDKYLDMTEGYGREKKAEKE